MRESPTPAVEGWAYNHVAEDGTEEIYLKVRIAPDLDEDERVLAITESFQIAKTLLTDTETTTH